jgi:hypothetical protein
MLSHRPKSRYATNFLKPAKFLAPLLSAKSGCVSGELLHQSAERAPNRKIITQRCFCAAAANRTRTHSPEEVNKNPDTRHFSSTRRAHHYAQRKYKLSGCVASGDGWPREHFTHSRTIFNPPMNLFLCKNILAPVQAE